MEEKLDIREKGGVRNGVQQVSDHRLFMQLLAFGDAEDTPALIKALESARIPGVLYAEVNDPRGVGLLTWDRDANFFVTKLREFLHRPAFAALTPKLEYSMFGRTYSLGHEPDLEEWLFEKPRRTAASREWPWAVWYPLRRRGEFSAMPPEEQTPILREHGKIGHAFGEADYAHDIRLACFGLDKNDNDFVIGLVGSQLYPLSACVQAMRKTKQTSTYIQQMGPFFIGKAIWQIQL
ncbi:MAG TPA: chlorite dismutase family protein [Bryobacteraceae bacterium]|nr:chlorite dismutase family protein [Bryobacteraceae bacterium]